MIPFAWMLSTSLKVSTQIFTWPITWLPNPVQWSNYPEALAARPFWLWTWNTLVVAALCVIGDCFSALFVGYAFSRLRWRGRDILFLVMLATMMLPSQVTMIPQFIIFSKLRWVNTFLPLVVPSFFGAGFYIFLVRQFMLTLPADIDDAAKLDGCGYLSTLLRVLLPQAFPPLGFVAINSFRAHWNNFLQPLIYLNKPSTFTLPLGLRSYMTDFSVEWGYLMAASVVALLPLLITFFIGQRYFIQGVTFTGVEK
jgi:ABC-type glycerol-3-phosphate transport system permease component